MYLFNLLLYIMKLYVITNQWAYWEFVKVVCAESKEQAFEISWVLKYWRLMSDVEEIIITDQPSTLFEWGWNDS